MDVSLTQSALPRVKAWAGESNAERDSCEGHCNYSLSVMAARALAAGLVQKHTDANGGYSSRLQI